MKEKLIAFTRNEKNVKLVNILQWILAVLCYFTIWKTLEKIDLGLVIVLCAIYMIVFLVNEVVKALATKNEGTIRKNKMILIVLTSPNIVTNVAIRVMLVISTIIAKMSMIVLCKVGEVNIKINLLEIFTVLMLAVTITYLINFVSSNTNEYFKKELK